MGHRVLPILVALVALAAGASARAGDEAVWLPPAVVEGMTEQLAGWLAPTTPGDPLPAARRAIAEMQRRVDVWGVVGTLARSPEFERLPVPRVEEPHLDAMARYQICNMALFLRFEGQAGGGEPVLERVARGMSAVTMAIFRLRAPFVADGGDPADIEEHLTSAGMNPVLEGLQRDPELFAHVESRCAAPLAELLDGGG